MRIPRALALFMLASLALPSAVAGQTPTQGGITISLESVALDGDVLRDTSADDILVRGYNVAECAQSEAVVSTFYVRNLPSGTTYVDAWIGSTSLDCSLVTNRQAGDNRQCVHLGVDPNVNTANNFITITLDDMMDPDDVACDSTPASGEKFLLWLFAANSTETTGTVTASQYGYVAFTVDASVPTVPVPTSDTVNGNSSVRVEWDSSTETNMRYNVYVDTTVSTCDNMGAFTPGQPPPDGTEPTSSEVATNSASVATSSLAFGQSALVYVTALDRSDNESNLSSAVCVTRVETVGFCDALEDGGEECTNSCAATLPVTRTAHGGLLLGLAFLALVVRRRTR